MSEPIRTPPARTRSGRELTDEDYERLADAAEEGFDLSTWRARPRRAPAAPDEPPIDEGAAG